MWQSPGTLLERAVITREWDEAVYESRMSTAAPPEVAQMLDAQTDRVYLVSQNDEGHRYFLRAFEWVSRSACRPARTAGG